MHNYLDFEKPISDLEGKIHELKKLASEDESIDTSDEVGRLEIRVPQRGFAPIAVMQVAHPALQIARVIDMHDDRVRRRPPFQAKNLANCIRIVGVGAESVDGFRWKRHEIASAQRLDGFLQLFL